VVAAFRLAAAKCGIFMYEENRIPAFEPRRLASAPGWYVRVIWPYGKLEHVPGFVSKQEAMRWIQEKAKAWLSEQSSVSRLN
jgi:hypothetical protein